MLFSMGFFVVCGPQPNLPVEWLQVRPRLWGNEVRTMNSFLWGCAYALCVFSAFGCAALCKWANWSSKRKQTSELCSLSFGFLKIKSTPENFDAILPVCIWSPSFIKWLLDTRFLDFSLEQLRMLCVHFPLLNVGEKDKIFFHFSSERYVLRIKTRAKASWSTHQLLK